MFSCFETLFHDADSMRIASGYISSDSIAELKKVFEMNKKSFLELIIGMHGFEGFTKVQYEAAKYLDDFLRLNNAGEVKIATSFKFHGKIYSFMKNNKPFAGIIGSSNLNSIFDGHNTYEADCLFQENENIKEIDEFITALSNKACTPFNKWEIKNFIEASNAQLDGHEGIERVSKEDVAQIFSEHSGISFHIPVKANDAPCSNLNAYFGKGRKNKKGFIKPRHWYEVELIVPKKITSDSNYPKASCPGKENIITVYTDDGWKFNCKISGDYNKNFRSADDLKILGRWIKGRLENAGALKVGDMVNEDTLKKYGRDNLELVGTSKPSVWLLKFGV